MYKMSVSVDDTNCNGLKSEVLSLAPSYIINKYDLQVEEV